MATTQLTRDALIDDMKDFTRLYYFDPNTLTIPLRSWQWFALLLELDPKRPPRAGDTFMGCRIRIVDDAACPHEPQEEGAPVVMSYFSYETPQ